MPSPSGAVDLRSDTVTTPTPEMRRAMADAEVGDDVYGEDPTVRRLESLAARCSGRKPRSTCRRARWRTSSRSACSDGPGPTCSAVSVRTSTATSTPRAAGNARVQLRPLPDADGILSVDDIERSIAAQEHHLPEISALSLENTHMPASGRPWRPAELDAVIGSARAHGLAVHCDGARIWNASIALGVSPAVLASKTDTVMFCLSKGLAAPGRLAALRRGRRDRRGA